MFKKILTSALVAVFMSSLLVGCGGAKQADKSEPKEKKQSPLNRRLQEKMGGGQQQEAPAADSESQGQSTQ